MIDILKDTFGLTFIDPLTSVICGVFVFGLFLTIFIGLLSRVLK